MRLKILTLALLLLFNLSSLFSRKVKILTLVVLLISFVTISISQDLTRLKYFKRTIAYVDFLLIADISMRESISDMSREYIARLIANQINLPRFYWESLPEKTVSAFQTVAKLKRYKSVSEIKEDVQRYLAPELIKILDINKEIRALQLVSEAERNRFISTKAKTLGINAEKLERIMNSGYIVVPFMDKFVSKWDTVEVQRDGIKVRTPRANVKIQAGIAFFRVIFSENKYSLKFSYEVKDDGKGSFAGGISPLDSAFIIASWDVVTSFEIAVRELFKLSAPILSAGFNSVDFELGTKEGILVDDGFDVFEFVQTPDGRINRENVGFVRVARVGDNRSRRERSKAQIIIGALFGRGRIAGGMFVEERPRFPFDFVIGGSVSPVKFKSDIVKLGNLIDLSLPENDTLKIKAENLLAYTGRFGINKNFGRYYGITQLWLTLDANLGILPVDIEFFGNKVGLAMFASFNFGIMKKFYFRRFGLVIEFRSGLSNFEFNTKKMNGDTIEYALSLRDWVLGAGLGTGFEFVINPDVNIGARVFYWFTGKTDKWSFLRKVGKVEERRIVRFSSVHMRGFIYQIYVNISIRNFAKIKRFE